MSVKGLNAVLRRAIVTWVTGPRSVRCALVEPDIGVLEDQRSARRGHWEMQEALGTVLLPLMPSWTPDR